MKSQSKYLYSCEECHKKYSEFNQLQIHSKQKHKESRNLLRQIINEQQIYQFEDKFFSFLGELSDIYPESSRPIQSQSLLDEHRFVGQANYLPNSIVRTPYQVQINVTSEIPEFIQLGPYIKQMMTQKEIKATKTQIDGQLKILSERLSLQRSKWQFADPYDDTINFDDQFSVLDLAKLVKNFSKRKLGLKLPEISLFLIWIARVMKSQMFKLIYQIIFNQILCYEIFLRSQTISKSSRASAKNWQKFVNQQISQKNATQLQDEQLRDRVKVRCFEVFLNWKNIPQKKLQKMLSFYQSWVQLVMPVLQFENRINQKFSQQILPNN